MEKPLSAYCFFVFVFGGTGVLNSGLQACKAGTVLLEPHLQSISALVILEMGISRTICPA
jgi:hypothetical protein